MFSLAAVAALALGTVGPAFAAAGWTLQATPSIAQPVAALNSVSCLSANACEAVGYTSVGTLAELWNGGGWSIQSTPGSSGAQLDGVDCLSSAYCVAVGTNNFQVLIEQWNGSGWTAGSTSLAGILNGVSCVAVNVCEVVGTSRGNAVVASWNGSTLTQQPVAPPPNAILNSVSCVAANYCTAVGYYGLTGATALAEHWNGSFWVAQTSFVEQGADTLPFAISCTSSTSCMAVGAIYSTNATFEYALAEFWNGSAWSVANGSSPNSQAAFFGGTCVSATDCTATGIYTASSGVSFTLAETWNGSGWTTQDTPDPAGAQSSGLLSISCPSATACETVGAWSGSNLSDGQTLAEQWTG